MKIFFSPASPYVRKVMVAAHELGLADRIEKLGSAASPINRDQTIVARNPLGKVPTFIIPDGSALYDSRVICEYLDAEAGGGKLFPSAGPARWKALVGQSLGDGLLDAALLARYETVLRPEPLQWQAWLDGQMDKIASCVQVANGEAADYGDRVDIGTISVACALGYLDFRFPDYDWRASNSAVAAWFEVFSNRPSMKATLPHDSAAQ